MPSITITLEPFQPAQFDLKGFEGKGCKDIADALAQMGETTHRHKKPEYNLVTVATSTHEDVSTESRIQTGGW
jgi:hypothetical protein